MQIFKETAKQRKISKKEAHEIFTNIISKRNTSQHPFIAGMETSYIAHCQAVAIIAETIADKAGLNKEKAYSFGLLHDCGKYKDERAENTFHGIEGYHYMMSLNLPEFARISITHSFYKKDFDLECYPYNPIKIKEAEEYISKVEYNDYDKLLQLSDILNNMGKTCSIEYRFKSICERYSISPQKMIPQIDKIKELKAYFDTKCGSDIYQLLNIKE